MNHNQQPAPRPPTRGAVPPQSQGGTTSETERVTLVRDLTADPELRSPPAACRSPPRLAVTPRTRQDDGSWTDGETSFHTINVWRDQASNAVDSLTKGARVLVVGRPKGAHLDPARTVPSTRSPRSTRRRSAHRCAGPPPR